ncbi:MAG: BamA/TamA family outer membrane protein [Bacteroidales bacterium]|nr:BamA/TamA family outer membrane protein [Bacteroidales bacterium]
MKKKQIISGRLCWYPLWLVLLLLMIPTAGFSQYFGRNKPSYQRFDFNVFQTPHFDIYHYFEDDSIPEFLANSLEKWYLRHQRVFKDTFEKQNPIIFYANHPDFQQTTAIGGMIGIGTMGVTEALKNRVVMPILETNAQTDHVIGHELVHVFQFRSMFLDDSLSLNSIRNLPLWLVEGMAEYFSLGSVDPHTAMIMRDAIHKDDFPTLRDMTRNYRYNPYRYGHAFVAFMGRTWGDSLIVPLFSETAKFGYERALERVLGLGEKTVSNLWKSAMEYHYAPFLEDTTKHIPVGRKLLSAENSGRINISPSVSPDGRHVAFFSERDLISIDLFLADAESGRILRKLASASRTGDIDGYNFFESMGTWSPDGRQFAHVAVKRGVNQLIIVDVDRPRRTREIAIKGVPSFNNPTWSPDGNYIVFNGLVDGRPDLFRYDLDSKKVTRLTNDRYSYAHASFSPDGRYLVFATDRPQSTQGDGRLNMRMNLGIMDLHDDSRHIRVLDVFPGADNLNPVFAAEQDGIFFLSNADGFRNLYFVDLATADVFRLTNYYTGISGITHMTPSVSIARNTGDIVYSHYQHGTYSVFFAARDDFEAVRVDPMHLDMTASVLPPGVRAVPPIVDAGLEDEPVESIFPPDTFAEIPFESRFGLTFIGSSGVGMATNRWGTGVAGGVSMLFSDITGDNQLFTTLAVNGEIYDFGGMVGYLNQKGRINWGGSVSHIPYAYAALRFIADTISTDQGPLLVDNLQLLKQRTFEDQISAFAYLPLSTTRRIEVGASIAWYYFRVDAINNYYYRGTNIPARYPDTERLDAPDGFGLQRVSMAYVGDNSFFGMASPMAGFRYRLSGERMFGRVNMYNVTADYRHYLHLRPFTFAIRGVHYGRYGPDVDKERLFYPLYLGFPGFVRGYDYTTLGQIQSTFEDEFMFEQLLGSRVLLGGVEIRFPFTGPDRLALISSGIFFTELALFLDMGVAWDNSNRITLNRSEAMEPGKRFPLFSTGPSLRINLFGALIVEPYLAFPFHTRGIREGVWGVNFLPGW